MVKFLIAGYYGLGNIGDEAILSGMVNAIKKNIDNADFKVISNNQHDTETLHNVKAIPQSFNNGVTSFIKNQFLEWEFLHLYKEISKCDVFILGGGELLQDIKIHYLPILLSLVHTANKKGKKTVIYGIGAGPINTYLGKKICKKVLKNVDLITVRDSKSKLALEKCGLSNVEQTADPAFAIDLSNRQKFEKYLLKNDIFDYKNIINVSLHSRLYNDDLYRRTNGVSINLENRQRRIAENLGGIATKFKKKLIFLPTVNFDIKGFLNIKKFLQINTSYIIGDHSSDFRRYISMLAKSEILIGMKLHSLIIASMLGIPFVPLSYSSKVDSFIDIFDLKELYLDIEDIKNQDFGSRLSNNFSKVWDDKKYYSNLILKRSAILREKAFENGKMVSNICN